MGLSGTPPNRARSCRLQVLALVHEHLADRLSLGGSGQTHVDRTLRSPTTMLSAHHNGHVWFRRSNRGPTGCPARGQMNPELAPLPGTMNDRRHQQQSHVCIFLNRIPN
jgi:hypothetical protein